MIKFDVLIEGEEPGILLHNPSSMLVYRKGKGPSAKSIPTPEEEAAAALYWTEDKSSIMIPAINIQSCMIAASSGWKVGKKSMMPYIAGSIFIDPKAVPFNTKKYEIDIRRVVIMGKGIMRARPKLYPWKLYFSIGVAEEDIPIAGDALSENLHNILNEGGRRLGLGDFRPQRKGPFGRFRVVE